MAAILCKPSDFGASYDHTIQLWYSDTADHWTRSDYQTVESRQTLVSYMYINNIYVYICRTPKYSGTPMSDGQAKVQSSLKSYSVTAKHDGQKI